MNDPVHSGGGVNVVVSAMSYEAVSVCTEVQAIARVIDGVMLDAGALAAEDWSLVVMVDAFAVDRCEKLSKDVMVHLRLFIIILWFDGRLVAWGIYPTDKALW